MTVKYELINGGTLPEKKTDGAACADCYANDSVLIPAGKTGIVPLGFRMEIPEGYYAEIRPRSGLTLKGILVQIGTIDSDYRGEVGAITTNLTGEDYLVNEQDRICQIMIKKITDLPAELSSELTETERGSKGFGSTGK